MAQNKIKNIVCNRSSKIIVDCVEKLIDSYIDDGWSIEVIQDSILIALQNKLQELNY